MLSNPYSLAANIALFVLLIFETLGFLTSTDDFQWWRYLVISLADILTIVVFLLENKKSLLAAFVFLLVIQGNPSKEFRKYAILLYSAFAPTVFFILSKTVIDIKMDEQIGFEALVFLTFEWGCIFLLIASILAFSREENHTVALYLNYKFLFVLFVANFIYVHVFATTHNSKDDLAYYFFSSIVIGVIAMMVLLSTKIQKDLTPSPFIAEFYAGGCMVCLVSVGINFLFHPAFASFALHYCLLLSEVQFLEQEMPRAVDSSASLLQKEEDEESGAVVEGESVAIESENY